MPPVIREFQIELTSDCNLRCRYCALNLPGYVAHDMAPHYVEQAIQFVERNRPPIMSLNVHGESTQVKGWTDIAARLRATGTQLNLISNFARYFSDEEIHALAGLAGIRISIDSVDREILRSIRYNVDFRIILHNLVRLRAAALAQYGRIPQLGVNCVVSQSNVFVLNDLVAFAAANGFQDITLHDLAEITTLPDNRPRHISTLPEAQRRAAVQALRDAWTLGQHLGLRVDVQPNLLALAENGGDFAALMDDTDYFKEGSTTIVMVAPVGPGQTRHCLDPWSFAKIAEDGGVYTCCVGRTRMGHLDDGLLEDTLGSEGFRLRRAQVLSGQLDDECRACPTRGVISVEGLRAELEKRGISG